MKPAGVVFAEVDAAEPTMPAGAVRVTAAKGGQSWGAYYARGSASGRAHARRAVWKAAGGSAAARQVEIDDCFPQDVDEKVAT